MATTTCEVCSYIGNASTHPCRFEKACACWRGHSCRPTDKLGNLLSDLREPRHAQLSAIADAKTRDAWDAMDAADYEDAHGSITDLA